MATQMVLKSSDAVEVSYANGCQLQLSACGSTFLFHRPVHGGLHPLHEQNRIQQRTTFVTSEFRDHVVEALDFRNRFAQCPFISPHVQQDLKYETLHADIHQVAWPRQVVPSDVQILPDGSLKVTSVDKYASVILAASHCHFTVEYIAKTSQPHRKPHHGQSTHASGDQESINSKVQPSKPTSCTRAPGTAHIPHTVCTKTSGDSIQGHHTPQEHSTYLSSIQNTSESQTPRFLDSENPIQDCDRPDAESHDVSHNSLHPEDGRWVYAWIVQYHSVQDYPDCWTHPLKLLLDFKKPSPECDNKSESCVQDAQDEDNCTKMGKTTSGKVVLGRKTDKDTETNTGNHESGDVVWTSLPSSLPLMCPAPHLHKWKREMWMGAQGSLKGDQGTIESGLEKNKVICSQGVIYRMIWGRPRGIEIYPGDGSIMRSSGMSGHFFTHYICQHGQTEERMYSVQSPPPHCPDLPYSVAKLVTRAARFLDNLCEESLQLSLMTESCCWMQQTSRGQHDAIEPPSRSLLEECFAPGLGKFSAYSSGHLRAVFTDRTCADMWVNINSKLQQATSGNKDMSVSCHLMEKDASHLLPPGVCRLLLPSGRYKLVQVQDPGDHMKYTQPMQDWARWVNTPPSERQDFYKDTVYDQDKLSSIQQELQKIRCFNFLVDNTVVSRVPGFDGKPIVSTDSGSQLQVGHHPSPTTETDSCMNSHPPSHVQTQYHNTFTDFPPESDGVPNTFDMAMVQEALRKTSQHVQELDKLLNN